MAHDIRGREPDIKAIINDTVKAALAAGRQDARANIKNTYKETQRRLYSYPTLLVRVAENKEQLADIKRDGAPERSKSITRFSRSGLRLSPDEAVEVLIQDLEATIARDEYEIATIDRALKEIESDPYFEIIKGRYLDKLTENDIAAAIHCDVTTVRRNHSRLVKILAVWLYGAQAG